MNILEDVDRFLRNISTAIVHAISTLTLDKHIALFAPMPSNILKIMWTLYGNSVKFS